MKTVPLVRHLYFYLKLHRPDSDNGIKTCQTNTNPAGKPSPLEGEAKRIHNHPAQPRAHRHPCRFEAAESAIWLTLLVAFKKKR